MPNTIETTLPKACCGWSKGGVVELRRVELWPWSGGPSFAYERELLHLLPRHRAVTGISGTYFVQQTNMQ